MREVARPAPGRPCPSAFEQTWHPEEPDARTCYRCGAAIVPYDPEGRGDLYVIPPHDDATLTTR